jgi:RNA polymerase primary sigma factor
MIMMEETRLKSQAVPDTMGQYLKESHRFPLLTAQQESATATAMRAGRQALRVGSQAKAPKAARQYDVNRRALIESNLRLVVYVAKRYRGMGMELGDLVQEGDLGLMEAVERFDPRRNVRFSTYAIWWVRQAITRALSQKLRTIKVPFEKLALARTAIKASSRLEMRLGRKPRPEEIAKEVGKPVQRVQAALGFLPRMESLDELLTEDGSARWELQADPASRSPMDSILDRDRRDKVHAILRALPPRQRLILRMRFGIGLQTEHTLAEIGELLRISRERVRQLEMDALKRLRESSHHQELEALIGG